MSDRAAAKSERVSVVIPTWGRSVLVRQAVLAALGQTLSPDEVLVSDDASPDDTSERLAELREAHRALRVLRQPVNLGCNRNVNAVIDASQGDIIAFCGDDDLFLPWHLERSIAFLRANPDVDLVHSHFYTLESTPGGGTAVTHHPMPRRPSVVAGAGSLRYLMQNFSWPFHASSLVFRRRLWREIGPFDPRYELADTHWFLRCAAKRSVGFLPEVHVMNRRHPHNLSTSMGAAAMHDEVNRIALDVIGTLGLDGHRERRLRATWGAFNAYRVARLAIARARAGESEACRSALEIIRTNTAAKHWVSAEAISRAADLGTKTLSSLQALLPGGREKYRTLGLSIPR